jgi:hypothetical protein
MLGGWMFQTQVSCVTRWHATSLKVNKAKGHEKNSEFFSGHFDHESLENPRKNTQKTRAVASGRRRVSSSNSQLFHRHKCFGYRRANSDLILG